MFQNPPSLIMAGAYRKSELIFQILPFLIMVDASSWQKGYDVISCAVKWAINSETLCLRFSIPHLWFGISLLDIWRVTSYVTN